MNHIIIIALALLFSALFSGIETGGYTLNKIKLKTKLMNRYKPAIILDNILNYPYRFIFTVLVGNNIAIYLLSKHTTDIYLSSGFHSNKLILGFLPINAEVAATLTLMVPLFLLAEVLPKNYFRIWANIIMYRLSYFIHFIMIIVSPITRLMEIFFMVFNKDISKTSSTKINTFSSDLLEEQLTEGKNNGTLTSYQSKMVNNVLCMHNISVDMIMNPLGLTPTLNKEATIKDFKNLIISTSFSKVFILDEGHVIGVVSLQDVLTRSNQDNMSIKKLIKKVLFINSGSNIRSLFYSLKNTLFDSAVIIDKKGNLIGSIFFEDILKFISK